MRKARRSGHWFRLSRTERGFFSLATRLHVEYRSYALMRAMVAVLKKLKEASDGVYSRMMRGVQMAWVFSSSCAQWGNVHAKECRNDLVYARYLGAHMCGGKRW